MVNIVIIFTDFKITLNNAMNNNDIDKQNQMTLSPHEIFIFSNV